jgi:low temperature requirement protein LtrA
VKSLRQPKFHVGDGLEANRRTTWLELFYDLIFIVTISGLAHNLSHNISLSNFLAFGALFIPVWWIWISATLYDNWFDCEIDLAHRLLILLQMNILVVLAANMHQGLNDNSIGCAISYVAVRIITIVEYLRAGHYIPEARPLTTRFTISFAIASGFWLISAFAPLPWRFILWTVGILVDLGTPRLVGMQLLKQFPVHIDHLVERLGLFTIIVLGESIVGVVGGFTEQEWDFWPLMTAVLGLGIAFCLWWIYFDSVDSSPLISVRSGNVKISLLWLYSHLILAMSLTTIGVGIKYIVSSADAMILSSPERWLLCGSVSVCLITLAMLHLITCSLGSSRRRKILSIYRVGGAVFVLALSFWGVNLSPVALVTWIAVVCIIQVTASLPHVRFFS